MSSKLVVSALLASGVFAAGVLGFSRQSEQSRAVPAPAIDQQDVARSREVAVIAGGCFWGVQGVYQHLKGVTSAVSGYAGGDQRTASYDRVSSGTTGHAESVEITFDPREVSYGRVLQVFFAVAHDPTELNRQGPDVGTQYRSAIFPQSDEQANVARAYIAQLNQARVFDGRVVTTIEPGRAFYRAEDEHQDFLERYPSHPYIVINDLPKIRELKRVFPDRYRATPVLVLGK